MSENKEPLWVSGRNASISVRVHTDTDIRIDCPLCGFEYVHIMGVKPLSDERYAIEIICMCEGCGDYAISLTNDEGYTMGHVTRYFPEDHPETEQ